MNDENCIFCKIVKGEIPCAKVYEDEEFFAFTDINPVRKGHLLLLTKKHYPLIQDLPDDELGKAFICGKKLILAIKKSLEADYVQVVVEGIQVPHFHIHLIPSQNGIENATWHHEKYLDKEKEEIAEKIKSAL